MNRFTLLLSCLLGLATVSGAQTLPGVFSFTEPTSLGNPRIWDIGDVDGDGRDDFGVTSSGLQSQGYSSPFPVGGYFVTTSNGAATQLGLPSLFLPNALRRPSFLRAVDDRDGDGIGDLVAFYVAEAFHPASPVVPAAIHFHSGVTGASLGSFAFSNGVFGDVGFASAGDRNGDGVEDFFLAYVRPGGFLQPMETAIDVLDGASLTASQLLLSVGEFFPRLARLGDVDGDGVVDFAAGVASFSMPAPEVGATMALSGATGALLAVWVGSTANARLGSQIEAVGDLDGDGISELGSLEPGYVSGGVVVGRVRIFDAAVPVVVRDLTPAPGERVVDFRAAGDLDGDGRRDVVLVLTNIASGIVRREARRGSDGGVLALLVGRDQPVGDLNGDGIGDLIDSPESQPLTLPRTFQGHTLLGASAYGQGSGGRTLAWLPNPAAPAQGVIHFQGAQPNAPVVGVLSLAPASTTVGGFPLLVSSLPQDVVRTGVALADATGSLSMSINLAQPALAGLVVYVQFGEIGGAPGTSNAIELIFGS